MSDYMVQLPLAKYRTFFLHRGINADVISDMNRMIIEVNQHDTYLGKLAACNNLIYNPQPIEIFIDTPGGQVYPTLGLVDIMEQSRTPIHTIVTGKAMSAGFVIAICGHQRFAHKHSTYMLHQLAGGAIGKMEDMKDDVKEAERLQGHMEDIILKYTKLRSSELDENRRTKTDWFMDSYEALGRGIVDSIIGA